MFISYEYPLFHVFIPYSFVQQFFCFLHVSIMLGIQKNTFSLKIFQYFSKYECITCNSCFQYDVKHHRSKLCKWRLPQAKQNMLFCTRLQYLSKIFPLLEYFTSTAMYQSLQIAGCETLLYMVCGGCH